MPDIHVRPATPTDLSAIAGFIRALAAYEELSHEVRFNEAGLGSHLFGPDPKAEVLIGEIDGQPRGFALYFGTFSTFEGKPGIWLEDLFVEPDAQGLGKALLLDVARIARERACARLEWSVLDWNEPSIQFYRSLGARPLDDWTIMRVDGAALTDLGNR